MGTLLKILVDCIICGGSLNILQITQSTSNSSNVPLFRLRKEEREES